MMTNRTTTASVSQAPSVSDGRGSSRVTRLALAISTALCPVWALADTLPTGGAVVHGAAQISTPAPNAMTINQSSDRAVVNWNGFSIGQDSRVDIHQPNANSAILNRVTGDTTSQIHGQLNANGRVFVVNPNGIFIGPTGSVNSGSFVASTLGIRTDDFVTGNTVFEGNGSSATVENAGNVQVVTGGYAALIGGRVKNSGTIQAPLGFVGLGSGERVTLDLAGDGFLQVALPTNSDDDGVEALIENSGTIQANGGTVQISAATARNAARHAINLSGVVEARTVSGRNGRITLGGGGGGKVTVSGKVRTKTRPAIQVTQSARPALRPERGGDITITGREIVLAGAEIDASGLSGGGDIRIGGEYRGGAGLPTADYLTVDASTSILADALVIGDGGRVITWSDLRTDFAGKISVRGGETGGDGGFAEVSGLVDLSYRGFTDALAPNGTPGALLLDPADIEIVAGSPVFNQILDTDLEAQLAGANVLIGTSAPDLPDIADYPNSTLGFGEQLGDLGTITVTTLADVTWNSGTTLTFQADNDIIVNGDLTPNNGTVILDAANRAIVNGTVTLTTGSATIGGSNEANLAGSGTITGAGGSTTFVSLGSVDIDGTISTTTGDVFVNSDGSVGISSGFSTTSGSLDVLADGTLTLTDPARPISMNNGFLRLDSNDSISIDKPINGLSGGIDIFAASGMTLSRPIIAPNANLEIRGEGASVVQAEELAAIDVAQFNLSVGLWSQSLNTLPAFDADNFVLGPTAEFLRVEIDPFGPLDLITDIYGLQGAGTADAGTRSYALANNIDASPTSNWFSLDAPVLGQRDLGFVPYNFSGSLDGRGFDISGLSIRRHEGTPGTRRGGLFSTLSGSVSNLTVTGASILGPDIGVIAAVNNGVIDGVFTSGTLTAYISPSTSSIVDGQVVLAGGIVAYNGPDASITESGSAVSIVDAPDPSVGDIPSVESLAFGGIAGLNEGDISVAEAGGSISFGQVSSAQPDAGAAGGIAGINSGSIRDVYATTDVSGEGINSGFLGGIAGTNTSTIENALANAPVSLGGIGAAGAVVGADDDVPGSIVATFYNTDVTGALPSGESVGSGANARTNATLRAAQTFFDDASGLGWNFLTTWSLPQNGVDHARLYATDLVVSAFGPDPDPVFEYNGSTTGFTIAGTYGGGPTVFRFNVGDSGDVTDLNDQIVLADENVSASPIPYTFPATFLSDQSLPYSVRTLVNTATLTPRPITLSVAQEDPTDPTGPDIPNNKTYGDLYTPSDATFTATAATPAIPEDAEFSTAFFADPNSLISAGLAESAPVSGSPYDLDINPTTFSGLPFTNYAITYTPATLTVNPRNLTINVNDAFKTAGDELIFSGTEFTTSGLVLSDEVTSLIIDSDGAPASASIDGSPYIINGNMPTGSGLDNYEILIVPGSLTINGRQLDIFVNSATKTYGETLSFSGTEFTSIGLQSGDTLTSLSITSGGAGAEAQVADGPFAIDGNDPVGTGLENYAINIVPGVLTIIPAPLTVTADDQTRPFGSEFTFEGNEFTVTGLVNDDIVESATLTSDGADPALEPTGAAGVAIVITDPEGNGLDNYQITLVSGIFVIAPGDLIITANDQTKVYGEAFTFDGTEFTVVGLAEGDSVDSVTLTSAGALGTAQVADGPFAIEASDAVGTGLESYTLVFEDGSFVVVPAPLTVTANDQTKQQGLLFTFDGTEFTTDGLLNSDSVASAVLTSDGAAAEASVDDSPFAIFVGDVTGTGVDNYEISRVEGSFTVQNIITPPQVNPVPGGSLTLSNPGDSISISLPGGDGTGGISGSGGPQQTLSQAEGTLAVVDALSTDLELAVQSCGNADQDFTNYMACLSESLDTYANALDQIADSLPSELETVSATIRTARDGVNAAASRAQRRLATATSDAERSAIRAEAIAEARGAISEAQSEIRKAISLIRADDPEVAAVQRETGARIVQAFDTIDSELARAVEL